MLNLLKDNFVIFIVTVTCKGYQIKKNKIKSYNKDKFNICLILQWSDGIIMRHYKRYEYNR